MTSTCCTRLMIMFFSIDRRSSASDRPSCFSAAWNCSSVSILFSFLMFPRISVNCSSLSL